MSATAHRIARAEIVAVRTLFRRYGVAIGDVDAAGLLLGLTALDVGHLLERRCFHGLPIDVAGIDADARTVASSRSADPYAVCVVRDFRPGETSCSR